MRDLLNCQKLKFLKNPKNSVNNRLSDTQKKIPKHFGIIDYLGT